ncbi:reverse transcriptase domain-containing protein [Tanacetum coccineum]
MVDQRTIAELLRAPTEGYAEAIMVPLILAEHFELKHSLINMMTSDQFFGLEKDNPHDHIRWFNKITSTIKYKDVPNSAIKLMLFPFSLAGAARCWLEKEPPSPFYYHLGGSCFDESFHEAWDRYKDLLRACPHHGFTELHQLDTFYNALNPTDQDSLNSAAGGNLLERSTQDVLTIIENKSKVRNLRNKSIVSEMKSSDVNSSSSSDISKLTHAVNQQTSAVTTAMTTILKQFQATPPPASVKAVEEICVTCGGAHPYYQCLAADGNTFSEFRDNIQGYVSAAAGNYNQGNSGYHPLGYNRGNNFNQNATYQAPIPQNQSVPLSELEKFKKTNEANMKAMQNQINNVKNELRNEMQNSIQTSMSNQTNKLKNMMASFFQMNTASTSGTGSLPSNTVANPKGELKAITTRSGFFLDGPSVPMPPPFINPEEDERVEKTLTDPKYGEFTIKVPPPPVQKAKPPSQRNYVVHWKCIFDGPYLPTNVLIAAVEAAENILPVAAHEEVETIHNMTAENKLYFQAEKEAIFLILTGIGDEIYSTVDACNTAKEMWTAIERLQQGESLNVQDVKTNLFWEFGKFTSRDGESMESYYSRFYKLMNELTRNNLQVSPMQVNVQFLQQLQPEWSRFVTVVKQGQEIDTVSYHKLFDVLKQFQNEVNDIRSERLARSANPLALLAAAQPYSDNYYQAPKPQRSNAPSYKQSSSTRSSASTRHKGKEIAKPVTPQSESVSEEDSDPEQARRDKDMQKNLALLAKYFKKLYKPTNNNLRTSSNSTNKTEDTTPRYNNDNQSRQFGNQRTVTVAGARETVGSPVVQKTGIQCFNCKGFGHYARECRKPKRVKDYAYHKEKMMMCKQAEQGVPLQAEQADWLEDTDEEIDEQELEAHYSYMAKIQEVSPAESSSTDTPLEQVQNHDENDVFANVRRHSEQPESINDTYVLEKDDSNVIPDSSNICTNDNQVDQNAAECVDERAALANLIANLTLDMEENKTVLKQLKKANASLTQELKECKTNLDESSRALGEATSSRDSSLIALQTKQTELEKYTC